MHRRHVTLFLLVFCSAIVLAGGPAPSPAPAAAQTPAAAPAKPAAGAATYAVDPAKSWLGFTAKQSGGDVDGRFEKFTAQISFADANLAASHFDVEVQTQSINTQDDDREIRLPFTFQSAQEGGKPVAWLKGGVTLNRLDYGVGQGEWKDTSTVANEVRVKFELRLLPK